MTALWHLEGPDILDRPVGERVKLQQLLGSWLDQISRPCALLVACRGEEVPRSWASERGRGWPGRLSRDLEAADQVGPEGRLGRRVFLAWPGGPEQTPPPPEPPPPLLARPADGDPPRPLAEGPVEEFAWGLRVGGRWLTTLWLQRLPGVEVEAGWLWCLVGAPCAFDLVLQVWPRGGRRADLRLRRRQRGIRARQLAVRERGEIGDPALEAAMEAASRLRTSLASSRGRLYDIAISMTLSGSSPERLRRQAERLRLAVTGMRGLLVPAWCDQGPSWERTALRDLGRPAHSRTVDTEELSSCWPWLEEPDALGPGRARLGVHLRTGAPVRLALRGDGELPNRNLGVVAASGSGKSYLGGLLGLEGVRLGVRTVVLDPENEHRGWCRALGGQDLELGRELGTGFNLLEMAEPHEAPAASVELVSLLCGPLENAEAACLGEAVASVLERSGASAKPRLADCLTALRETEVGRHLARRIEPWTRGPAGSLFNQAGSGPRVESVVTVGMRELPEPWVPAALLLLSQWIWSWIRRQPGPKQAIVDEAGQLAEHPPLMSLMARLARRVRKYEGSLVLLTQSAGDLLASEAGELMAVNSATLLLGSQHPAASLRLQRAFDLDEAQRRWLERAGRGEFLLVSGGRRSPVRIEAPDLYHDLLTRSIPDPRPAASAGAGPPPGRV